MFIYTQDGETALHLAAEENSKEAADVLISAGADLNITNIVSHQVVLHISIYRFKYKITIYSV